MIDDEKFFAWLDGELDPAEAAEIEARVAADPELSQRADQHRALAARLKHAFDPIAEAPVPERFQSALRRSGEVVNFATVTRARSTPWLPQWAAIAATLVFGILVGTLVPQRSGGPVTVEGGKLYAASALNHALDTELASAPRGDVRIGLTFRDRSGQICRSFSAPAESGLACRSGNGWQLKGLFAAPEGQASDYRMAGTDPNLAALVDSTMAGAPLDADSERAALKRHWR